MWDKATPLAFETDWAGKPTRTPTHVRALWSSRALYLLWELDGAGLANTDRARPIDQERVDLYEEDCVELMLAPDPRERRRYFEIELGPYGHFFDIAVDRIAKKSDNAWSAQLKIGTSRDDAKHRAIIEVAIEAPEIVQALAAGAQLPVGLYRMEGKAPRQYLAAFPTRTPKPNFHVPAAFGALVLEP